MARVHERKTRDLNQVKCINDYGLIAGERG